MAGMCRWRNGIANKKDVADFEKQMRRKVHYVDTYQYRKEEPRYSRRVGMTEIEQNDFNLNISRYVSTAEGEEEIDLTATHGELVKIEKEIQAARDRPNTYLKELGLPQLP
jgi:type I restriction enzyme M protein